MGFAEGWRDIWVAVDVWSGEILPCWFIHFLSGASRLPDSRVTLPPLPPPPSYPRSEKILIHIFLYCSPCTLLCVCWCTDSYSIQSGSDLLATSCQNITNKTTIYQCTVIRFVWVSAKFGTCTVVSVNGTLVEDKMRRFKGEGAQFSFNKCPIDTHDGASAKFKFSTNSHETDNSVYTRVR